MNELKYKRLVRFEKSEIHQIMELYSKKISIGEWKDYSITFYDDHATFSIHRSIKQGASFQIRKNQRKNNYILTYQNRTLVITNSLHKIVNYLKKPVLRIIK